MAALKGERARVGVTLHKQEARPLSIQKANRPAEKRLHSERIKKAAMGGVLVLILSFLLVNYSELSKMSPFDSFQTFVGLLMVVSLPIYVLYRDMRRYKRTITQDIHKLALVCVILIGAVAISRASAEVFTTFTANIPGVGRRAGFYAVPISTAAMLATLLFDIHLGIVMSIVMSIFGGLLIGHQMMFGFYTFIGSVIASFSLVRCTRRSALLNAGLFVALANIASVICLDLYQHVLFTHAALYDIVAGITSGFFSAILISGILPLLESTFKMVTDISLLEYSDLNRPLLKQLMVAAPGTYHHSVIIGSLAEAAAESVGENPLLARVASYYHDIGKIKKPEYFVENQAKGENRHDRLTPSMSSLIISSHVKDGYELAKEHKLPPQISDIIQQHHGNALMTYFYEKARSADGGSVSEDDYRYPGPRPQTKIAAIVMLADAVEAASRVLEEPSPDRISALVDKIIGRFFVDGQLTECDLTLKDLTAITRSFNQLLSGIYHHRVDYPGLGIPSGGRKISGQNGKLAEESKGAGWDAPAGGHDGAVVPGMRGR